MALVGAIGGLLSRAFLAAVIVWGSPGCITLRSEISDPRLGATSLGGYTLRKYLPPVSTLTARIDIQSERSVVPDSRYSLDH